MMQVEQHQVDTEVPKINIEIMVPAQYNKKQIIRIIALALFRQRNKECLMENSSPST